MKKEIELCPYCKKPLIWTFIYPDCEWYCLNCKSSYPMFCDSITIDEYNEDFNYYKIQKRLYEKIFKAIIKDLTPRFCYKKGCEKCGKETHYHHLTDLEKLKDKVARETLETIKFNKSKAKK